MPVSAKKTAAPAAKKAAAKKPAATASKSTAIVPWEQEMKDRAAKASKAINVTQGFKKISTQGGVLAVDDTPMDGNELRIIIVGATPENQFYDKPYDPKNPTVPVCYSFGDPNADEPVDGMAPHTEAETPQGDDNGLCAECWANKMGSADIGRGKACKNIYRVAVITEDALESAEDLTNAEVRMLNVPVMSVKNLSKYVHACADDMERPPETVITLLKLVPDAKSQFQVTFAFEELINFDADLWDAMKRKCAEVAKAMVEPYPKQADLDAANAQPVRPQGRMAQAMNRSAAVKRPGAPAAKKAAAKKSAKY